MSSLHYTETGRTTGDVEAKYLFFCLFCRLMRKQADQSGATREEIRSDRVKENKVCLPVFLTLLSTLYSHHAPLCGLWIRFISPVIWKKPSLVAMVNDLYTVNCNFLQLLIKWLRLLGQISTFLTLIYLSRRNLLNTRDFFPSSTFKVIIQ